jgi:hypothetical protein
MSRHASLSTSDWLPRLRKICNSNIRQLMNSNFVEQSSEETAEMQKRQSESNTSYSYKYSLSQSSANFLAPNEPNNYSTSNQIQSEEDQLKNENLQMFDSRFRSLRERKAAKPTLKGKVYNFLERPTGWKCFVSFALYLM